ncbi:coil containing protein [Vibrio phage 1.225.O._10N.261.48.B7]|nr:coil containing protein [Vibrio phage 1.225.O._10N.261.48.B7]
MAYSPSEKYPGAVDVDPDYQGGKFRDNNPSTTNNGSPLKAIDRNELLARDEAIMNDAGFEYSGVADTPQDSQLFKAYKASLGNGANLLSNHNFLIQTPDDSQPLPSATPTSYPPGHQIFSGVFANETTGITNLTYIDGRVSFSGGDLYFSVPNTGAVSRLTSDQLTASVADFDGKPRTRGVSFALVGDEYRVTVGVDALEDVSANPTPIGSMKFEQGGVATGHEVQFGLVATGSTTPRHLEDRFADVVSVKDFGAVGNANFVNFTTGEWFVDSLLTIPSTEDTAAFKAAITRARDKSLCIYAPGSGYLISDSLFFGPLSEADANLYPTQARNICSGLIGDGPSSTILAVNGMSSGQVLDMSGLREKYLKGFRVDSLNPNSYPDIGILTARLWRSGISAPTNNDFGTIDNVTVNGYWRFTPYFAHATEEIVVNQSRFYTKSDDSLGCWVSSDNISNEGFTPTASSETSMSFATGSQSNLHQTHKNCDYSLDTESPTRSNLAMCWIKGSLMVHIEMPFFNNNSVNHDCVRADTNDAGQPSFYGVHVFGANAHQSTKSGMRLVGPNTNCSWSEGSRTMSFEDGQVIVEAFTNSFQSEYLDGDLVLNNSISGCNFGSIRNLNWDTQYSIQISELTVRGNIVTSTTGTPSSANNFEITRGNTTSIIRGEWAAPSNSALDVQIGVTGARGVEVGANYAFFNSTFLRMNARQGSSSGYNFWDCVDSGVTYAEMRKGGYLVFPDEGTVAMKDTVTGVLKKITIANGVLTVSNL